MTTFPETSGREEPLLRRSTGKDDAHCPHCGALPVTGTSVPSPEAIVVCGNCEGWVGRGRVTAKPAVSTPRERLLSGARQKGRRAGPVEGSLAGRTNRPLTLGPPPVPRRVGDATPPRASRVNGDHAAAASRRRPPGRAGAGAPSASPVASSLAPLNSEASAARTASGEVDRGTERARPFLDETPSRTAARSRRLPRLQLREGGLTRLRRPRPGWPTRAGLMRALPIVLLVIGALLLVEGGLTVLWKEPFSALFAAQTQNALGDDLEKLERDSAAADAAARSKKATARYQARRAVTLNRDTGVAKPIGRLRVDKIGLNEVVVQGTDEEVALKKGPGHYTETPLPGQRGNWTVGIAGHRTTYGAPFRNINKLKKGDDIVFAVPYGRFTYEVVQTKIVDASYTKAFVPKSDDRIVLTACHPLYSAAQRILVYGKLRTSAPRGGAQGAGPP